ncbi:serine hydrolase [Parasphingopyxis sp.]|uniref:serine hydrolase domain-containing protein n=1 Tax=Parasphingopyxis sp. TaxID=1920299 RepID=UPI0026271DAE|nr:serine hydrolase domain-containing protein [Parasphingopyxis sp.]
MQTADPDALGFIPNRLSYIPEFINERYIASGKMKNFQLTIGRGDDIALFASGGIAREDGAPLLDDQLFRIASMTKPITSVAFMQLVEQGKVALDDPVHRVLPEFKGLGVYAGGGAQVPFATTPTEAPMRMVDLLRHTSGLTYAFQNRSNIDLAYRDRKIEKWHGNHDLDSFVADLGTLPLEFSPGTAWNYSVSTDVLGAVIQRVSGQTLDAYFADHILAPLGMDDTFFTVPESKLGRLGDCWTWTPKEPVMFDRAEESIWSRPPKLLSGGGGLISTSADYHRFCRMLLGKGSLGDARILGRKTIELMAQNHLPGGRDLADMSIAMFSETQNAGTGFGLGLAVNLDPARSMMPGSAGEFYWGGMYSTAFFVDPVEDLTMVFMTQLQPSNTYPIRRELKTLIYSALA